MNQFLVNHFPWGPTTKAAMATLEHSLLESRAAGVKSEGDSLESEGDAVETKAMVDTKADDLVLKISLMRAKDALTMQNVIVLLSYILDPALHTTLLQVHQNKIFEDPDKMISWETAMITILQGKVEEISFDYYVRAFTFRRADSSTLRSWLIQAQNFLLAMNSKDLKLCKKDKIAFVLRNVSPKEMDWGKWGCGYAQ